MPRNSPVSNARQTPASPGNHQEEGCVFIFKLRVNPRIAVIAPEKLIGFLVVEDLFLVAVPLRSDRGDRKSCQALAAQRNGAPAQCPLLACLGSAIAFMKSAQSGGGYGRRVRYQIADRRAFIPFFFAG